MQRNVVQANSTTTQENGTDILPFYTWLETLDKTRTTGWRWRKNGIIETINIFGKLYVTRDARERFKKRAMSGEFHKDVKPTTRAGAI